MKPNFALSLSFDGIRLLQRADDGWLLVGDVALDAEDLNDQLADLRERATVLSYDNFTTKLLIPNEQIKYTALQTAQTSLEDVNKALEGATPYGLDQLVIDFERTGGRTHIAAVARETLQEAEGFAVEHKFNPICFAAVSEPFTFSTEVFFGPTQAAKTLIGVDQIPERDSTPVAVTGVLEKPAEKDDDIAVDEEAEAEAPLFTSRKASPEPESAEAPLADETVKPEKELEPEIAAHEAAPEDDVLFTRRKELVATPPPAPQSAPVVAAPQIDSPKPEPEPVASLKAEPEQPFPRPKPAPVTATKEVAVPDDESAKMTVFGARAEAGKVGGKPKYLGLMLTAGLIIVMLLVALWANTLSENGIAGWFQRSSDLVETETAAVQEPAPVIVAPEPVEPPQQEVVEAPVEAPTAALPIVRAPAGRVLSPAEADRIYAATGVYQRAPRLAIEPKETTLDGLDPIEIQPTADRLDQFKLPEIAEGGPDMVLESPLDPPPPGTRYQRDLRGFILAMPDGTWTPDGAMVFAGAPEIAPPLRPGTVIPAPDITVTPPSSQGEEGLILVGGRPPIVPPLRPDDLTSEQDAQTLIQPEAPTTDVGDILLTPNTEATAEIANVAADGPVDSQSPSGLATANQVPDSLPQTSQSATQQSIDTPEVALDLNTGRPDIVPPLRPAGFSELASAEPQVEDASAPTAAPGGVVLSTLEPRIRPSVRPQSLLPEAPAVTISDPELAGLRPQLRPNDLIDTDEDVAAAIASAQEAGSPSTADIDSIISAIAAAAPPSNFNSPTAQAVTVSVRPDTRPRNFAQVVARARAAAPAPTVRVATSSARPSGPVPGGVARAATVDNAIRLRDMNLIGVYGRPNDRRALVRLSNGRYVKVEIGSTLDGGRVTAINDTALNYVKRGRTYALQMPSG